MAEWHFVELLSVEVLDRCPCSCEVNYDYLSVWLTRGARCENGCRVPGVAPGTERSDEGGDALKFIGLFICMYSCKKLKLHLQQMHQRTFALFVGYCLNISLPKCRKYRFTTLKLQICNSWSVLLRSQGYIFRYLSDKPKLLVKRWSVVAFRNTYKSKNIEFCCLNIQYLCLQDNKPWLMYGTAHGFFLFSKGFKKRRSF